MSFGQISEKMRVTRTHELRITRSQGLALLSLAMLVGACEPAGKQRPDPSDKPDSSQDTDNGDSKENSDEQDDEQDKVQNAVSSGEDGDGAAEGVKSSGGDDEQDPGDDDDDEGDTLPNKFDLGTLPDAEIEARPCAIDFLFVVDNSGSMRDEQNNLKASVPQFIDTLKNEVESLEGYHIGVTATDTNWSNPLECRKMGALITDSKGAESSNRACGPYKDGHNFITPSDDLDDAFGCAAKPGISGSAVEKPIDAIRGAISEELSKPGQCNAGFLRDDALLVVTIITDEEDDHIQLGSPGSAGDPPDWYKDILAAKGNDPRKVVVLALIGTEDSKCVNLVGPENPGGGANGAQISERLQSFVQMFGQRGFVGDVCAQSYGPFFKDAVSVIDAACEDLPPG